MLSDCFYMERTTMFSDCFYTECITMLSDCFYTECITMLSDCFYMECITMLSDCFYMERITVIRLFLYGVHHYVIRLFLYGAHHCYQIVFIRSASLCYQIVFIRSASLCYQIVFIWSVSLLSDCFWYRPRCPPASRLLCKWASFDKRLTSNQTEMKVTSKRIGPVRYPLCHRLASLSICRMAENVCAHSFPNLLSRLLTGVMTEVSSLLHMCPYWLTMQWPEWPGSLSSRL